MKRAVPLGLLPLLATLQGCSELPRSPQVRSLPAFAASAPATTQETIEARLARQTAAVYRQATQLSYKKQMAWGDPPVRLWCTARHGLRHELELRVYDASGLIYELHKHPDGATVKIRERNYIGDQAEEYEVLFEDMEGPTRRWDLRCDRGLNACMFGADTVSWLGRAPQHPAWFDQDYIAASKYLGIRDVEGFSCDVVQNHRVKDLTETFYLDRRSHVLRRWTQVFRGVTRDRVFSQIEIVSPENKTGE